MSTVRRIYVEKKAPFAGKARDLRHEISGYLGIKSVEEVRIFIRYDVENVSDEVFEKAWFEKTVEVPFEDTTIPVPNGYHEFLTALYGDYMKLPENLDHVYHHVEKLEFYD